MKNSSLFTLAAFSAACLLTVPGAFADNNDTGNMTSTNSPAVMSTEMANTVMDVTQFRDSLRDVRDIFQQIRENHRLALATQDSLIAGQYTEDNRNLELRALGLLNDVSRNWQRADVPSSADVAAIDQSNNRYGTANLARFATESDDTAFVRNAVWDLYSELNADKLNGRDPVITNKMMDMLDAAITRSENPSFRMAWVDTSDKIGDLNFRQSETATESTTEATPAPAPETTTEESTTTTETTPSPAPAPETTTETDTTDTTTTTETPAPEPESSSVDETTDMSTTSSGMGSANLPQTGGDPSLLYLFGSSLAGLGVFIRKRS
jgi:LPXTG-motif cell wall-anchored protein